MENNNNIPTSVRDALSAFINIAHEYSIPFYINIPIPFSPLIARNVNMSNPYLELMLNNADTLSFAYQYQCIAKIKFVPEMVTLLKAMKEIDPNFQKQSRKVLLAENYKEPAISAILKACDASENIDYSFAERLSVKDHQKN